MNVTRHAAQAEKDVSNKEAVLIQVSLRWGRDQLIEIRGGPSVLGASHPALTVPLILHTFDVFNNWGICFFARSYPQPRQCEEF
jgi:hypothetical protein